MNACLQDQITFDAQRIRGIQDRHFKAHHALNQWGLWCGDLKVYPTMKPPSIWDQFKRDENTEYGEEGEASRVVIPFPAKAEARERQAYDEKLGQMLDERIHSAGGLNLEVRKAIRTAYVTREVPEDQFWKMAGCSSLDSFCERLEAALVFVGRFA